MSNKITYSVEQNAIIDLACPPNVKPPPHPIIRVTAAAGTGKTTTLIGYSKRLIDLNHSRITYVTFSKAGVEDAKKRLQPQVFCSTIHAIALRLLNLEDISPADESKLDDYILDNYQDSIADMLRYVIVASNNSRRSSKNPVPGYIRQVAFYIRKTLTRFLQSADSKEEGFDATNRYKTYYPAKLWHERGKIDGLPTAPGDFYVKNASRLFEDIASGKTRIVPFDFLIKNAQLDSLQIPCEVLLVDESQDCTECQIDWLRSQTLFHTQVVFVGDPCQTIYGFRGAKSRFLMGLSGCIDRSLTRSYRFGSEIASVANTILYIKEHSPQTPKNQRNCSWIPYRVIGASRRKGILDGNGYYPKGEAVTIIGRKNISLLMKSLELLGRDCNAKIALMSKGSNSGMSKWNLTLKEMSDLFNLFINENDASFFNHKRWPKFREDNITTWDEFVSTVKEREMTEYWLHISIINEYQEQTLEVLDQFRQNVLDKKFTPNEATYLLTTVHGAKGLEWDNVEVLDDFNDLNKYRKASSSISVSTAEFDQNSWGDDLNLWYVAVTRSRRYLYLPDKFKDLIESFKYILKCGDNFQGIDEEQFNSIRENVFGSNCEYPASPTDIDTIYESLVCKWRNQVSEHLSDMLNICKHNRISENEEKKAFDFNMNDSEEANGICFIDEDTKRVEDIKRPENFAMKRQKSRKDKMMVTTKSENANNRRKSCFSSEDDLSSCQSTYSSEEDIFNDNRKRKLKKRTNVEKVKSNRILNYYRTKNDLSLEIVDLT